MGLVSKRPSLSWSWGPRFLPFMHMDPLGCLVGSRYSDPEGVCAHTLETHWPLYVGPYTLALWITVWHCMVYEPKALFSFTSSERYRIYWGPKEPPYGYLRAQVYTIWVHEHMDPERHRSRASTRIQADAPERLRQICVRSYESATATYHYIL